MLSLTTVAVWVACYVGSNGCSHLDPNIASYNTWEECDAWLKKFGYTDAVYYQCMPEVHRQFTFTVK